MASRQSRNLAVGMKPKLTMILSYVDITPSRIKTDVVTPENNQIEIKYLGCRNMEIDSTTNQTNFLLFLASCFMMTNKGKIILLSVK